MFARRYLLAGHKHNVMTKFFEKGEINEGTFNLANVLSTAFTNVQGDVTSVLAVAIPIAIGIAGIIFVARKAMKWFKSMSNG